MYVGFIDLEKAYDGVKKGSFVASVENVGWGGKLLSGTKSLYVDSSPCVRVKGCESDRFRIDSGVRQGCIISSWLFDVYMDGM